MVVSNSEYSLVPEIANGLTVDFEKPDEAIDKVLLATHLYKVLCVIATDDSVASIAAKLAESLQLQGNQPNVAELTRRKDLARQALKTANCRIPDFELHQISTDSINKPTIRYPIVVKPLSLSGSRGVIRVNNEREFQSAVKRIDKILETTGIKGEARNKLLLESYLDGDEYAIEGFVINGQFCLMTIFDKPEPLTGPFFEETYYITPTRLSQSQQDDLIVEVASCCKAYGIIQGPVHAEIRLTPEGPVLLELAARTIGGQCGQLIEFSMGQKLEELVIQGMCGQLPTMKGEKKSAGVLMIPVTDRGILKRVEGLTDALQVPHIKDIEIHIGEGYPLVPLPEGSSYLGFIFAQSPSFEETWQALKSAYQELNFVTSASWQIEAIANR
ncbi:MAG: biotin carboxylase [Gammaproteobacteria bacterium]